MKKFKRVLSIVLTVLLVIGAVPFSGMIALADSKIMVNTISVTVNKDYIPKDGLECITRSDFITVSSGDVYERTSCGSWYDDVKDPKEQSFTGVRWHDINHTANSVGYNFESGRSYYCCISFDIRDKFKSTHAFPSGDNKVKFEFKNLASSEYEIYAVNNRGGEIYVILKFTAPGERTYNDIETVHATVYGPNSYQSSSLPPCCNKSSPWINSYYANYEMSYEWIGDFYKEESYGVSRFKANNNYKLILTYNAKSGYKFDNNCEFMFATPSSVGYGEDYSIDAEPKSIEITNNRTKLTVTFEFFVTDYEYINTLVLENSAGNFLATSGQKINNPSAYLYTYDVPYGFSGTYDAHEAIKWRDDRGDTIAYAPQNGLYYFTYHFVVDDSEKYRFDSKLNFTIKGIDSNNYWVDYEIREEGKVVYATYYFVSDYHIAPYTGKSAEKRFICTSYDSLKFALENEEFEYIEIQNVDSALPFRYYENVNQVNSKYAPAIVLKGKHDLKITGQNYFKINQVDTTAYFAYEDFVFIPSDGSLDISGDGKLTVQFGQPDRPVAMFFNKGTLNISEATLYAEGIDYNVYPQVINSLGKLNIYSGNFNSKNRFPLENGTVLLNYGSETYIDGGTFNATYGNGAVGTNYGLMINTRSLNIEINRGLFKSSGGIKLPDDTTYLSEYAPAATHRAYVDGFRYETYDLQQEDLKIQTKVVELIRDFEARVSVPTSGKYPSKTVELDTDKYVLVGTPKWYCDYEEMDINNETFVLGSEYKVEFTLKTVTDNNTYREPDKSKLSAYVNGKSAETYNSVNNSNEIVITYEFGTCYDAITRAAVTGITEPKENEKPDTYCSVLTEDSSLYTVNSITWYKYTAYNKIDAVPMESDETFVANKYKYYVSIKLKAKGTRVFNYNEWGYTCMDGYIDNYSCSVYEEWLSSNQIDNKYVYLEYDYGSCPNVEIEEIYIWNVEEPWAGMLPSYTLDFDLSQCKEYDGGGGYDTKWVTGTINEKWYYAKNGVRWYDLTDNRFIFDFEPFIEGHEYEITINLVVVSENYFYCEKYGDSLVNAYINGETAEIRWDSTSLEHVLTKTFICKSAVDIYDVTGDGNFDIRDIVRSKRIAAKVTSSFSINPDFDENGYVDSWDLVTIKKALFRYKKK